jgi:hypothetical protein
MHQIGISLQLPDLDSMLSICTIRNAMQTQINMMLRFKEVVIVAIIMVPRRIAVKNY